MLKKRILVLGFLLALAIVGQVLLRPCLGKTDTAESITALASATPPQTLEQNQDTEMLQSDLWRTFFYMLGFVAMIGGGAWLVCRKFSGGLAGGGQLIRVGETVRIGPRKALHLIRVGKKAFLVGSGGDSFTLLADVSDSVSPAEGKNDG